MRLNVAISVLLWFFKTKVNNLSGMCKFGVQDEITTYEVHSTTYRSHITTNGVHITTNGLRITTNGLHITTNGLYWWWWQ